MNTAKMACSATFRTLSTLLSTEWQHVATVTAPVGAHVRERLEPVGNPVVDLLLVRIGLGVGLADALGDDLGVAFLVAGQAAV